MFTSIAVCLILIFSNPICSFCLNLLGRFVQKFPNHEKSVSSKLTLESQELMYDVTVLFKCYSFSSVMSLTVNVSVIGGL